jgi:arsenite-transporting ATPase
MNGILQSHDSMDKIEAALFEKQQAAIKSIPESLLRYPITAMPLRAYNITGIKNVRRMLSDAGVTSGKICGRSSGFLQAG